MTLAEITNHRVVQADGIQCWSDVCSLERLTPNRGVAALVDGRAVAVFLLAGGELFAVANVDPFSGASVLSRGIVGECDGVPTVASPLYKQRFDLATGRCLEGGDLHVETFAVRALDGVVQVAATPT